ncbi:MAG: hypothetical protein QNJ00_18020 [Woeseiaceae bacterium]|nr:hypothetical protein [Woeseiaceae bacterium]
MHDETKGGVPFEADEAREAELWASLTDLPREEPGPGLRQGFYHALERAARPPWWHRLSEWLGFRNAAGWLTATACVLVGVASGYLLSAPGGDADRLLALEQNVATLNRSLILDRIENTSASKRLRGVIDAVDVVQADPVVARALLDVASGDRVFAVRSAAIDALAPELANPEVGEQLMAMLEASPSPLVQLALVDLVLRNGSNAQLEHLVELAREGRLHPELNEHVLGSAPDVHGEETI